MSSLAAARLSRRDPAALRRMLAFVGLVRAAAPFVGERAGELARTVLGWLEPGTRPVDSLRASVERLRRLGLEVTDDAASRCAEAMADAWRELGQEQS